MKNYYEKTQELKMQYEVAKENDDEQQIEKIKTTYEALKDEIAAKGNGYATVYRMYADARERENEYIDINDVVSDNNVENLINNFRENGIEKFTFSSGWSSAVETAWLFTKNGCTLEGLVEINSQFKDFETGEFEKLHGYLFNVN